MRYNAMNTVQLAVLLIINTVFHISLPCIYSPLLTICFTIISPTPHSSTVWLGNSVHSRQDA